MNTLKRLSPAVCFLCFCLAVRSVADDEAVSPELLRAAAEAEKVNREMLKTWKGSVTQQIWHGPGMATSLGDSPVAVSQFTFACDTNNDKARWSGLVQRYQKRDDAVVTIGEHLGYMYDSTAVYSIQRPDASQDPAVCSVHPADMRRSAAGQRDFNLEKCFSPVKGSTAAKYEIYLRRKDNSDGTRFLQQEGSLVKCGTRKNGLATDYVYDLAKGGSLVYYRTQHPEASTMTWSADYMEVDGVWVPQSVEQSLATPAGELVYKEKIVFDKVSVNVALSPEEFTPEAIGVRQFDYINDTRTDATYTYGDKAPLTAAVPLEDDLVEVREVVEEEPVHSADDASVLTTESEARAPGGLDEGSSKYAMFLAVVAVAVLVILAMVVRRAKSRRAQK